MATSLRLVLLEHHHLRLVSDFGDVARLQLRLKILFNLRFGVTLLNTIMVNTTCPVVRVSIHNNNKSRNFVILYNVDKDYNQVICKFTNQSKEK